jgi:hypothetical protein
MKQGGGGGRGGVVERDWGRKAGVQMEVDGGEASGPPQPKPGTELNGGVNLHLMNRVRFWDACSKEGGKELVYGRELH